MMTRIDVNIVNGEENQILTGGMADDEIPCSSQGTPPLTFIKRGGGTVLLHDGHQYVLKIRRKKGTSIWECINRKKMKCTGKITVQGNDVVDKKKHYVCQPDFVKNELDERLFLCKEELSSSEGSTVKSVYNAIVASYQSSGLEPTTKVPTLKSVKSTLYRSKNSKNK